MNAEQQHFVEEIGLFFEENGLPRMAGRILGWLLICDPPSQTSSQLAEGLQASKGSISTMTRMLIQFGLIERVGLPGERRAYFRIKPGAWGQVLRGRMAQITAMRQLADRGLDLLDGATPERKQRLEEMRDLYAFFEREFPIMLEHWEAERRRNAS